MTTLNWSDCRLELVNPSLDTCGLLDEAIDVALDDAIFGLGSGSFSLHLNSDYVSELRNEGQYYLKFYRAGVHVRDYMIAVDDHGYTRMEQWSTEYVEIQVDPLDMITGWRHCLGATPTENLVIASQPIDDAFKEMVDRCMGPNAYDGVGSLSRVLTGMTIAADESAHPTSETFTLKPQQNLYEFLVRFGPYYDVDWQVCLEKTTGKSHQFVFKTFYPRRGVDRTETNTDDNRPVLLNDADASAMPAARRWRNRRKDNFANAVIAEDGSAISVDATSITTWGLREFVASAKEQRDLDLLRDEKLGQLEGWEIEYRPPDQYVYRTDFQPGDLVTVSNHHLGLSAVDLPIKNVRLEYVPDDTEAHAAGQEKLTITVGAFEKTVKDQIDDASSSGGGGSAEDPGYHDLIYYHQANGGTKVPYSDDGIEGVIDYRSADGSVVWTGNAIENWLDASVPGALYWSRDAQGDPFLYPTNAGDDVQVGASIYLDNDTGNITATRFQFDNNNYTDHAAGGVRIKSTDNIIRIDSGAAIYCKTLDTTNFIISHTAIRHNSDNVASFGLSTKRATNVYSYKGDFADDITMATTKSIIHPDGDATHVILGNTGAGTDFEPRTLADLGIQAAADNLWTWNGTSIEPAVTTRDVSVGSGIYLDNSTGYVTTVRVRFDNNNYLDYGSGLQLKSTNNIIKIDSGGAIYFKTLGTSYWVMATTYIRPNVNGAGSFGHSSYRASNVYSIAGDFTGDVNIGTGKGITHDDGVAIGYILMANGTRYVPHTFAWGDLPDHRHAVNGNTGSGTASGTTSSWSVTGSPNYSGLPLRTTSGALVYLSTSAFQSSADGTHVQVGVGTQDHTHTFSDAHTHPVTIQAGAPAAP